MMTQHMYFIAFMLITCVYAVFSITGIYERHYVCTLSSTLWLVSILYLVVCNVLKSNKAAARGCKTSQKAGDEQNKSP